MTTSKPLKILIAEDNAATVSLLKKFLLKRGHAIDIASNGQQALDLFMQNLPDLVLMDVNMPIMNGLEAIRQIRQRPTERWIPIIILSALSDEDDIIIGLESGADDYLTKPVNLSILNAKLQSIERIVSLQNTNLQTATELRQINQGLEQEQLLAKQLIDKMLYLGNIEHCCIQYWLCPNRHFSGDLIAASEGFGNKLFVMLADSTGHGLSAALPTITIAKIFHSMCGKGFTLSSIAAEMNAIAKSMLPPDRFVATALFAFDFSNRLMECWNGGIPTALVVNESGELKRQFESRHLAIGILSPSSFDASTEIYQWQENCEVIAYSDGLIEAESPAGEMFGTDSLIDVIRTTERGQRVPKIKQKILSHLESQQGQDDISLVSVSCNIEAPAQNRS